MKTKCAICGKIEKVLYEFRYLSYVFGYVLYLCHDCGEKVADYMDSIEFTKVQSSEGKANE